MGIYAKCVLPRLTHLGMGQEQLRPYRERTIGEAQGRVLEIGFGSGRNLPLYGKRVEEVVGIDASQEILALAQEAAAAAHVKTTLLAQAAESLPFDDRSFRHGDRGPALLW